MEGEGSDCPYFTHIMVMLPLADLTCKMFSNVQFSLIDMLTLIHVPES